MSILNMLLYGKVKQGDAVRVNGKTMYYCGLNKSVVSEGRYAVYLTSEKANVLNRKTYQTYPQNKVERILPNENI